LQRCHLILPPEHHARHHSAPFDQHYCITVGWMNVPLQRIGFFRMLERFVTAATGALPRHDDIGEAAALAVASENGVIGEQAPTDEAEKSTVGLSGR
jgi:ubiquitin-conjugating enzyme E2 variant